MSTKSRVLFIYRNKNEEIPEAFLKKACNAYPSWSGLAFVSDGGITFSRDHEGPASPNGITAICKKDEFKDKSILFCLGKEEEGVQLNEDHSNLQPFDLISTGEGDNEVTKVVIFIDGDLEDFAKNTSPEGRPFLFAGKCIAPYIHSTWNLCNGDIEKFTEQVRMAHVEAMLLGMAGKDSSIAIMIGATDKSLAYYSNSDKGDEFSWGYVNDTCGWNEETEIKDNKSKTTLKMSGSTEENKDTTSSVMYSFRVAAHIIKNADIRALYFEYHGAQPPKYQDRPTVSLKPDKYEKAHKDGRLILSTLTIAGTEPTKVTPAAVSDSATKIAEKIPNAVDKEQLKKFVDANVLQVMSPEEMAKNELPLPTFWEQSGLDINKFNMLTNKEALCKKLIKDYPDRAWELIRDLSYANFQLTIDLEKATAPEPEKPVAPPAPVSKNRFKMSG